MNQFQPDFQECPVFSNAILHDAESLALLQDAKSHCSYKKGQIIFQEGTNPFSLFCVNSGKVKLYKRAPEGKELLTKIAKPGDLLGSFAIFTNKPYPVSASALEDSVVCIVPLHLIKELIRKNNELLEAIVNNLSEMMKDSFEKMANLSYKQVRGRIADALLSLAQLYREDGFVRISRDDLASYSGTVKETAIRILKEFKEENLIETKKSDIYIKDEQGLLHISRMYL